MNKHRWYLAITIALSILFVEGMSHLGLWTMGKYFNVRYAPIDTDLILPKHRQTIESVLEGRSNYTQFDPILGWSIMPNGKRRMYRANSQGLRSNRRIDLNVPEGKKRILTFGDSFTHGDQVWNRQTWQAAMERMDDDLEVVNFGVAGYGLDQAYLRYLDRGTQFETDVVMIGYMTENLNRIVNVFRPFYFKDTGIPLSKPRFRVYQDSLVLSPNPLGDLSAYQRLLENPEEMLPAMGSEDHFWQTGYMRGPFDVMRSIRIFKMFGAELNRSLLGNGILDRERNYNKESEAYGILLSLFSTFYREVLDSGGTPVIVIFPNRKDILRYVEDRSLGHKQLTRDLEASGYRYIDLTESFEDAVAYQPLNRLIGVHYTPEGNALAARRILKGLRDLEIIESAAN